MENYDKIRAAIKKFWKSRRDAKSKNAKSGRLDQGERSSVTGGKNLDGFVELLTDIVRRISGGNEEIRVETKSTTVPGYFRPTKKWDLLVFLKDRLIAAIELKSQVGSFGKNFNNRAEEAIGSAHDFWAAFDDGILETNNRPFLGWLILVESTKKSTAPTKTIKLSGFKIEQSFDGRSYLERYDHFCKRLVEKQLYCAAALIASDSTQEDKFRSISPDTSFESFVEKFSDHISNEVNAATNDL